MSTPEGKRQSGRGRASLWRVEAEQRVRVALRRYRRPLVGLVARGAYEAETRAFVRDFLTEALGYADETLAASPDAFGRRADYGLRVADELIGLVEVRRVTMRLDAGPARPVERVGDPQWLVLTNAVEWHLYHVGAEEPTSVAAPVIRVDLLSPLALAKKAKLLVHLTRESFEHGGTESLLLAQQALAPDALAVVLKSVGVLRAIQRELRRKTGQPIETSEIAEAVRLLLASPPQQ